MIDILLAFAAKLVRRRRPTLGALAVCAAALTACSSVPDRDLVLGPDARKGMIAILVEPTLGTVHSSAAFFVSVRAFDPTDGTLVKPLAGGGVPMTSLNSFALQRHFVVGMADPGLYALEAVRVGINWAACFDGGTQSFEVRPGEVTFVGLLDPRPTLVQLARQMPNRASGTEPHHLLGVPRPHLTPPPELPGWRDQLRAELAARFPKVTAELREADLRPITFKPGRGLLGERMCDGVF